jgi:serine/threonine-protein phosphatase 2A regulatory subunit B''
MDPKRRLFNIIAQPKSNYLTHADFKPLFKHLLETHPGLEFLQATPEF